jgi:hypothetical protein
MDNTNKLDHLIQFILLTAGQEDDYINRWLGPIHLVKYVYLADLAFSRENEGQTYTDLPWKFHHYGPWEYSCFERIEPALVSIGAEKKIITSKFYDDDYNRWCIRDSQRHDELKEKLPISIAGTISRFVHRFGIDTNSLLHFVYKTRPMTNAAPGETLDFNKELESVPTSFQEIEDSACRLTARQMKKRENTLRDIKSGLRAMLDKRRKGKITRPVVPDFPPPRYDEVYLQGLDDLDRMAGAPPEKGDCRVIFSDDVWKSKARFDSELS